MNMTDTHYCCCVVLSSTLNYYNLLLLNMQYPGMAFTIGDGTMGTYDEHQTFSGCLAGQRRPRCPGYGYGGSANGGTKTGTSFLGKLWSIFKGWFQANKKEIGQAALGAVKSLFSNLKRTINPNELQALLQLVPVEVRPLIMERLRAKFPNLSSAPLPSPTSSTSVGIPRQQQPTSTRPSPLPGRRPRLTRPGSGLGLGGGNYQSGPVIRPRGSGGSMSMIANPRSRRASPSFGFSTAPPAKRVYTMPRGSAAYLWGEGNRRRSGGGPYLWGEGHGGGGRRGGMLTGSGPFSVLDFQTPGGGGMYSVPL
jgi:hypothetical protein